MTPGCSGRRYVRVRTLERPSESSWTRRPLRTA